MAVWSDADATFDQLAWLLGNNPLDGSIEWSTGEYWMTPLANALLALSCLLPPHILPGRKLG